MKLLLLLPLLMMTSCTVLSSRVDTRGATAITPDFDGDGVPDIIVVESKNLTPALSGKYFKTALQKRLDQVNGYLAEATK